MTESPALRERLVATLHERGALHDDAVERAFLTVPRDAFLPGVALELVYQDEAIVTKQADGVGISSSSQPAIMAIMLEQLELFPGARVLEIGAGTGYNAALIQELVGDTGHVTTVDIDEEVAGWARERLDSADYGTVVVQCSDGADGWPDGAPFDRIELTVGAADIAPAWFEQLREGGILVLPLLFGSGQIVAAFEKRHGRLVTRSVEPGGFMRMRGRLEHPTQQVMITDGIQAGTSNATLPTDVVRALLQLEPRHDAWETDLWAGFYIWGGLWELPMLMLWSESGTAPFFRAGFGVVDRDEPSLAVVGVSRDREELALFVFGGDSAANMLRQQHDRWREIGSPSVRDLRITAWPAEQEVEPSPDALYHDTQYWHFEIMREGGEVR